MPLPSADVAASSGNLGGWQGETVGDWSESPARENERGGKKSLLLNLENSDAPLFG